VFAVALHTFIAYVLALNVSSLLARTWCLWVLPALGLHSSVLPRDWRLQHLELITILPALMGGYVNLPRFIPAIVGGQIKESKSAPAGIWAWIVPTCVLLVEMAQHHAPSSVLYASSRSVFRYFFEIERHIPSWNQIVHGNADSDPVRIALQIFVTAPFYAGLAYTAGASIKRLQLLERLFALEHQESFALPDETAGDVTPEPPSSSAD
jgi:hypothetical protein